MLSTGQITTTEDYTQLIISKYISKLSTLRESQLTAIANFSLPTNTTSSNLY